MILSIRGNGAWIGRIHGDSRRRYGSREVVDLVSFGIVDVLGKSASVAVSAGRQRDLFTDVDIVGNCSGSRVERDRKMVELECEKPSLPPYAQTEAAARDAGGILYFCSVAVPLGDTRSRSARRPGSKDCGPCCPWISTESPTSRRCARPARRHAFSAPARGAMARAFALGCANSNGPCKLDKSPHPATALETNIARRSPRPQSCKLLEKLFSFSSSFCRG